MCPVCLATIGLGIAGGVSAGGITTYVATHVLRRRRDEEAGDRRPGLEASKRRDRGARHGGRRVEA
jgi:hypothetical protein